MKVDHLEAYTAYGAQAFLVLANAISKSDGSRASKLDPLVRAYGAVDELNSLLGLARCVAVMKRPNDILGDRGR